MTVSYKAIRTDGNVARSSQNRLEQCDTGRSDLGTTVREFYASFPHASAWPHSKSVRLPSSGILMLNYDSDIPPSDQRHLVLHYNGSIKQLFSIAQSRDGRLGHASASIQSWYLLDRHRVVDME